MKSVTNIRNSFYSPGRKSSVRIRITQRILLCLFIVGFCFAACKTPESKGISTKIETPRYLRLNYDVVYETSEGVTLLNSGKLFARGLFYEFQINSSLSKYDRVRASSYTEDNQIDFKHLLTSEEMSSLENKQYQYFSMPNDSRASVLTGIHNGKCYIRWEWQKESFVFVFETDLKNETGDSPAGLGKEFHENIRKGLRIF
ncbi:hypothetical protein A0128_21435 [Leptospira tipperaryensis]|uniref:Uncharacterized protein n=1 Tax=Leptospira tipperaryensis TaxID=2564040 RepID=A0A1D7V425_9LEPT|nr:hypothetical protein [Leptospira tipperaryensis]AOP36568.1 hypothetical protein A0128_21435 [Leptospira tipperaryensis]